MNPTDALPCIGIMGGTFDPPHHGHELAAALFYKHFKLTALDLMPCYVSAHKQHLTQTAACHRLNMLSLMQKETQASWGIDRREITRQAVSYTVDSLQDLRAELGKEAIIYFSLGSDSFADFYTWEGWEHILTLCHLVVFDRPGTQANSMLPTIGKTAWDMFTDHDSTPGKIYHICGNFISISSTTIRRHYAQGASMHPKVHSSVNNYIMQHKLYRLDY